MDERLVVRRLAHGLLAGLHVDCLDRRNVDRRRQIVEHAIEQRLHALVLEGRAAEQGIEGAVDRALADEFLELRLVRLVALKVSFHGLVVDLNGHLDELVAIFLGLVQEIGGDVDVAEARAKRILVPDHALHADEIDNTFEIAFSADWQLHDKRLRAEAVDDRAHAIEEVGADLVHLVDEDHARHVVLVALPPDGLGLRLNALVGVEQGYRAVEHAQGALHLDGEVHVAGRVDDVDALALPVGGGRGGRNRDAALLLLLHPVHRRGAVVHLADLVALAGVVQDTLSRGRLTGIDVRHDADIAIVFNWGLTCHD